MPDLGRVAAALRLAHDSPVASRNNKRAEEAAVDAATDEVRKEEQDRKRRRDRDTIGTRVGDVMRSVSTFDQDVRDSLGISGEARRGGVYRRSEADPNDRESQVESAAVFLRARARQGAVANQIRRMLEDAEDEGDREQQPGGERRGVKRSGRRRSGSREQLEAMRSPSPSRDMDPAQGQVQAQAEAGSSKEASMPSSQAIAGLPTEA